MKDKDIKPLIPDVLQQTKLFYVVVIDMDGKYAFVNNVFTDRFSFLNRNFIGQAYTDTVHPDDVDKCIQTVNKCLAHPDQTFTIRIRKPDTKQDNFYWTEWEFSIFKNHNGTPIGIMSIGYDISESELASRQARLMAQKVESIIEDIPDAFYQLDRNWRFIKVNKVAEYYFGKSRKDLLGVTIWEALGEPSACNYPQELRKAMQDGVSVTFEEYNPELDKWLNTVVYPSTEGLTVFFKDVTKEKTDRQKLIDSERKLKAILDSTQDGNLLISADYTVLSANKAAKNNVERVLGKKLEERVSILDYTLPETVEQFLEDSQKALAGQIMAREVEIKGFWWEISYYPVYDVDGNIFAFSMNNKDIDQRKKSDLYRKAVLSSVPDLLFVIDAEGTYLDYHAEKSDLYVPAEVFLQKRIVDIMPSNVADLLTHCIQKSISQQTTTNAEYTLEMDGVLKSYQVRISPFGDNKVVAISRDITLIKQKELEIADSEQRLQKTIEAIPHPLIIVSEDRTIQFVNEEFQKIFKYTENEVLGETMDFLVPEEYKLKHHSLKEEYIKNLEGKKSGDYMFVCDKDREEVCTNISLNTFTVKGEKWVLVILQDVTELKQNQDKVIRQNEILRQIAWQQSHELRRPIANIMGLCDLLKQYELESKENQKKYLEYLMQSSKELDHIIHQIVNQANEIELLDKKTSKILP